MRLNPKKIASIGTRIVSIVLTALAVTMLLYSGLVLYDSIYTNRVAFTSSDLSQYRPDFTEDEPTFEEMLEINPDTQGWIMIKDTNIDYPVVQGKDDVEYSMKDIYGKNSLTGSIYLTAINNNEFTDSFNLIYGHHMDNGAMFGDIAKYTDEKFFYSHQEGILVTRRGAYDLKIFARLSADAYDSRIYCAGDRPYSDFPDFLYYVEDLAVQWDPKTDIDFITKNIQTYIAARDRNIARYGHFTFKKMPKKAVEDGMQLVALSTCADATTNGRQLLVATMKLHKGPLPDYYLNRGKVPKQSPWGHGEADHWALLNAVCTIMVLLILLPFPLRRIRDKYQPIASSVREGKKEGNLWSKLLQDQKTLGVLLELVIATFTVFWFIWTEDPRKPMVIVDGWTLMMILMFAAILAVDILILGEEGQRNLKKYLPWRKINKIK